MPLTLGSILQGRYRIDALLGQGGMGAVYLAADLRLNTLVAVKENLDTSPHAQQQFAAEAGALVHLRHANLPRVTDYFYLPGYGQYLVMDYVQGEDLEQMVAQRGRLPEGEALAYIGPVLEALEYLHGQRVFHRDVKPANIKVTPGGQVVLVDFGLVKVGDPSRGTAAGARAVTAGYAPLEQYGAGGTDARTDVYAAGATLYALLTGQAPPDAPDLVTGRAQLVPPRRANPGVSAGVEAAVARAMAMRPADRFQTAGAMRAALVQAPQPPAPPGRAYTPTVRVAGGGGSRATPTWLWGGLVLGLAVLAVFLLWRPWEGGEPTPTPTSLAVSGATLAPSSTPMPAPTSTLPPTSSPTPAPTSTLPPTPSPTPAGGGSRIAFSSDRDGDYEIYVMNADGSGETRLTDNAVSDDYLCWSPDGTRIAFTSGGYGSDEIYVMNADGTGQTKLTDTTGDSGVPAWSPDGTRIAFASNRDGDWEIYVMSAGGADETRLTVNGGYFPAWSPDGTRLAFFSRRDGEFDIYVMNADGAGQTRLTSDAYDDRFPAWTPDGARIAFRSDRDGGYAIYVMEADGAGQIRLAGDAAQGRPAWSPDGRRIAFVSMRDGNEEIYVMNADGSGQTNVTNSAGNDHCPAWSPH